MRLHLSLAFIKRWLLMTMDDHCELTKVIFVCLFVCLFGDWLIGWLALKSFLIDG
jgi:hypothetical protein